MCMIAGVIMGDAHLVPTWPGAGWLIVLALSSQVVGWLLITVSLPRLPAALTSLLLTRPAGRHPSRSRRSSSRSPERTAAGRRGDRARGAAGGYEPGASAGAWRSGARSMREPAVEWSPEQVLGLGAQERARPRAVVGGDVPPGAADEHDRLLPSLVRARSAAGGELVGDRDPGRAQLAAGRVGGRASPRAATGRRSRSRRRTARGARPARRSR